MAGVPFHYVELRAFCYATEDEKRVEQALSTFLTPDDDAGEADDADGEADEFERTVTEGFHGDRIVVLSTRIENADGIRHVLDRLSTLDAFEEVLAQLDERIDEDCSFFISLDKQAAFRGEVRQGEGITLRGKVEAYPAKKETAVENLREALAAF